MDSIALPIVMAVVLFFIAAPLLVYGFSDIASRSERLSRRLVGKSPSQVDILEVHEKVVLEDNTLQPLQRFLSPSDSERFEEIRWKLYVAGYRSPAAVRIYFALKWGVALAGLLVFSAILAATVAFFGEVRLPILATMGGVILSFFIVDMLLTRRIAYRRLDIEKGFPDALDLLLICIEAGNGLDQAFAHVADELQTSYPVLADELGTMVAEVLAGKERSEALADLSRRCDIDDVSSFVTVVRQVVPPLEPNLEEQKQNLKLI